MKYVFKPYNKIFPSLFQKEKERILSKATTVKKIEHVGSTAVEGLGGKGIIDIAIAIDQKNIEIIKEQLQFLGYHYRPQYSTVDRLYFISFLPDPEEGERRYHIHVMLEESKEWKDMLYFRDYLRLHPKVLEEYANLKKQASALSNQNGKQYRSIKEPIFEKVRQQIDDSEKS